ncbi:hypothetical protein PENSUB_9421 [Penicillium subrubescens]|uniref:Alpha/beta hydrolase fold-3 domain-containing protein n=1 Tax=Penicillium subrubescens TaxID=1316194 RepID=A0A1Q5TDM7_9EURO|nr:hypothetical protein PENSUB_9421 [Penicillium subrubescens]
MHDGLTRPVASNLPTQSHSRSQGPNVILYLRPGPLFQGHAYPVPEGDEPHDLSLDNLKWAANGTNHGGLSPQQSLASMTSATVVTVNYRLGAVSPPPRSNEETIQNSTHTSPNASPSSLSQPQSQPLFYKYPTPIHDTLAAFDWIKTNLNPAHLGVIGSHIGGSLALMLALTEAQSVKAVASIMPVTDWVGLDDYCTTEQANANTSEKPTSKRASKKKNIRATAPRDIVPLLAAREALFSSPERCFDAFASPILFLRSAGRDVPSAFPVYLARPEYPVPVLKNTRPADLDGSFSNQENDLEDDELSETGHTTVRRRKALSRWPPYGLDYGAGGRGWGGNGVRRLEVTLPWVRVYVEGNEGESSETVLADQGEEMVSVMRRACFFGREKGFGERRVSLVRGVGEVGLGVGEEVGGWFERIFDGRISDE